MEVFTALKPKSLMVQPSRLREILDADAMEEEKNKEIILVNGVDIAMEPLHKKAAENNER